METEQPLPFSVASVVEDVLQQHGTRSSDVRFQSRKADEASLRRYEAAGWLRKMVGVVGGKDLPAEPSEEEFRLGLRSGIVLCNVLNKVQPGAVQKVVEGPYDSVVIPDGAALSAFQYFENVRNFLVAVGEMGLPTFEASDLNPELFMNYVTRTLSIGDKSADGLSSEQSSNSDLGQDLNEGGSSRSINMLVRTVLSDKKQEEIPVIVESMLNKVMEEFERRLTSQSEALKANAKDISGLDSIDALQEIDSWDIKVEGAATQIKEDECQEVQEQNSGCDERSEIPFLRHQILVQQQQTDIQELKETLNATKAGMQFFQLKYLEEFNNLGKHLHGLAHAATGYRRVLEENRKLYNQVQDLKGNIRIYCRVRPFLGAQPKHLSSVDNIDEGTITIITPSKYGKEGRKSFTFNKVFGPSATQVEVFSDTQPLIRSVLDGYNVCIFAYGQTGSGKTHTMTGPKELTEEGLGVNYRALTDLFILSNQRKETICYDISVQMLEIYNEQVRDLLVMDGQNKRLEIRNSSHSGINVPDANLVPVSSTSDVINLMNLGHRNRAVGATAMNDRSSRSHSCLTVHVQGRDLTSGSILRGSMHLVDLAGSERVDKSEATGDRLKEAQHINKSLAALGDVISSLAQKNSHVPYRNSKLTQLLQDSLGGQAKTLMFVHISPEPEALGETLSTLKFAERVGTVELGAARVNKDSSEVKELKEQIASLKAALAKKEGGEMEQQPIPRARTPDKSRRKSLGFLPTQPKWQGLGGFSNHTQQTEDSSSMEVHGNSRRHSLDLHELMNSPPWPPASSPSIAETKEDERECSGDWIDKVMLNKDNEVSKDENQAGNWEAENRQLPQKLYKSYICEPTKVYPEQTLSKLPVISKDNQEFEVQRIRYEAATTDESDDAATSDCSETDLPWQLNLQLSETRATNIPSLTSKAKKTQPKIAKATETRSLIPSLIPAPTRKLPNGIGSHIQKPGRQAVAADGRRKTGHGK
ncbi:kinesin-like protein KIN-14G [Carica papaya]|uniref:kinesin-like protein KIN-14G n=1 Tax=Carica papaya TaxID=3649 RepID=UPI000B8CAF6C|nr:kinesin-like protein KIN-14G [Carica papaya]